MSFDFATSANAGLSRQKPRAVLNESDELKIKQLKISSYLSVILQVNVNVILTNNRITMISSKRSAEGITLRLHKMFGSADETTLKAISFYASGSKSKKVSSIIDEFINKNRDQIKESSHRRQVILEKAKTKGGYYNLNDILIRVKERYFAGEIDDVVIYWGKKGASNTKKNSKRRVKVRSRVLGLYSFKDKAIRINPILDSDKVPGFFIEWVVYHELLHHLLPVEIHGSQRRFHTKLFREYESNFDKYKEARAWEDKNIHLLLS